MECKLTWFLILQLFISLSYGQSHTSSDTTQLKILSWNIYMIPRIFIHSGQLERANGIVESLKNENVDIVVFEEAFDRKSREIIRSGLKKNFPYESGDPAKNVFFKCNSGVWIISKIPITVIKKIYFKNGRGTDRLACKGAMLIEAKKNNFSFQLAATHLQSDLQHKDVRRIRKIQYQKISKELLEPFSIKNIPQFVVGDMNTIENDSLGLQQMLSILNMKQCFCENKCNYSFDCSKNDFLSNSKDPPQLIDYIIYDKKEFP